MRRAVTYTIYIYPRDSPSETADGTVAFVDPQLIEQALSNLVENAQRHSGSTDIAVSLVPSVAKGPVRLIVEDHGVGIPPEHLPQIFERFHRVDPARAAESGGAGLGLSIVRRIARLHGGDVTCENAVPHGARFTLTLPTSVKHSWGPAISSADAF
jgi:signal transduction histidine kinase